MSVTVVSGGVRSGKSRHAQALFDGRADVTYLATGAPAADSTDPEWRDRVARHVASRPPSWVTVETLDVADVLRLKIRVTLSGKDAMLVLGDPRLSNPR